MTMDGKTFSRGLGARAESEITYNLGGAYQEFRAVIGHDDIVSVKPGKIQFIITGDDKTLYKSPVFQKGSKPLPITVNVTGVQEIVLGVRTPKGVSKGTMANWAMARFLKK